MNLFIAASRFSQNSLFNVSIIPPVFLILCKYKGFLRKSQRIIRVLRKPTSPPLPLREGPPLFPSLFFSWRRLAALGNMKADFHCAHLHNLSPQGTGDVPTALSIVFTTPSVPLIGDRNGALNRFAIWLADHQRSTPAAELRFFVRG